MDRPPPSIGLKLSLWMARRMYQVEVYLRVRRAVMVEGMSIREALPGVRVAPGHGAQDDRLLSPTGLPAAEPAPPSQPFDKLRRSPLPASSTGYWKTTSGFPGSSATPPSASLSACGTSTGSPASTPS